MKKGSLEHAIEIATEAHRDQLDKAGEPYILHPIRVMEDMITDDEKIVAVLHDRWRKIQRGHSIGSLRKASQKK
jgi:(p)ppGpp synthase/HD superfamily hydrolase